MQWQLCMILYIIVDSCDHIRIGVLQTKQIDILLCRAQWLPQQVVQLFAIMLIYVFVLFSVAETDPATCCTEPSSTDAAATDPSSGWRTCTLGDITDEQGIPKHHLKCVIATQCPRACTDGLQHAFAFLLRLSTMSKEISLIGSSSEYNGSHMNNCSVILPCAQASLYRQLSRRWYGRQ